MKESYKRLPILFALIISLTGCVGAAMRGGMTDDISYQQTMATSPSIAPGYGRIFVYSPIGGPNIASILGVIDFLSIDKDIVRFGGESYFYMDVPAGTHDLTTTAIVTGIRKNNIQPGQNNIEVTVPEAQVVYVRIGSEKAMVYSLETVLKSEAEEEMIDLPLWTNTMTTMKLDE